MRNIVFSSILGLSLSLSACTRTYEQEFRHQSKNYGWTDDMASCVLGHQFAQAALDVHWPLTASSKKARQQLAQRSLELLKACSEVK